MAVYGSEKIDLTFTADIDLSAKQWFFVTAASTAGNVKVATGGSGPAPFGILQNDPVAGEEAVVRVLGTSKVSARGDTAITYADYLQSGSDGQADVNTTACTAANAVALEALASGSGVLIECMLLPMGFSIGANNTP